MVSCQKGPTGHAYAWPIGPFWQDTLKIWQASRQHCSSVACQGVIKTIIQTLDLTASIIFKYILFDIHKGSMIASIYYFYFQLNFDGNM